MQSSSYLSPLIGLAVVDFPLKAILQWLNSSAGDVLHGFDDKEGRQANYCFLLMIQDYTPELIHPNTTMTELESNAKTFVHYL